MNTDVAPKGTTGLEKYCEFCAVRKRVFLDSGGQSIQDTPGVTGGKAGRGTFRYAAALNKFAGPKKSDAGGEQAKACDLDKENPEPTL